MQKMTIQKVHTHLLARKSHGFPTRSCSFIFSNMTFKTRSSLANDWRYRALYLFYMNVCSPEWLRQQSTELPTDQQKLGAGIALSRYFRMEQQPKKGRKFCPSLNLLNGNVDQTRFLPLSFHTSKQPWYYTRLLLTTSLNSSKYSGNYLANSTVNHGIARMISKHHLLSPESEGAILTRSQEQNCSSLYSRRQHCFTSAMSSSSSMELLEMPFM